jgi:hypothetical protein
MEKCGKEKYLGRDRDRDRDLCTLGRETDARSPASLTDPTVTAPSRPTAGPSYVRVRSTYVRIQMEVYDG